MLISCKCLNITEFNNSVDDQILKRNGAVQSLLEIVPGPDEIQGLGGLAGFYYIYREFVKSAVGPVSDLNETVSQTDLAFDVHLKQFLIKYCINCETITHVKNISTSDYWINCKLLTTPEKMNVLKENKQFSKVFGILMTHDSTTKGKIDSTMSTSPGSTNMTTSTPTTPTTPNAPTMDLKSFSNSNSKVHPQQQALVKKLTQHLEEQLQRDYNAANERISRFIEQQAAILESNLEKAKQEYQILVSLINRVPDELKVIINSNTNNVNNNEDLISAATAITKSPTNPSINKITIINDSNTTKNVAGNPQSLFTLKQQQQQQQTPQPQLTTTSLDTPPATPDSTPMSVGNSPTFRQQTSIFGNSNSISGRNSMMNTSAGAGAIVDGGGNTIDSDCLFELDGMENYPVSVMHSNQMSDVEETEDAEDALTELQGIQIPRMSGHQTGSSIARSLPVPITCVAKNPKMNSFEDQDSDLVEDHSVVDIAASIKALAKSVHGDTIFGDLPRPRFNNKNN